LPLDTLQENGSANQLPDKGTLLLVDDVRVNLRLAEFNVFRHFPRGWAATTVASPHAAVEAAQSTPFDVVIMDEWFGDNSMRGSDAIAKIREHEAATGVHRAVVICCTADLALAQHAAAGQLPPGADAVWSKPAPSAVDGSMQQEVAVLLQRKHAATVAAASEGAARISDAEYLREHGVEGAIQRAVVSVLTERPADPVEAIGRLLS